MIGARLALLVLVAPLGCYPRYSAPLPEAVTDDVVRTMRRVVDSVTRLEGRPPASLDGACSRLAPSYGRYGRPPHCSYWLHRGDTLPLDGWRNPLRYESAGHVISIQSAGADGRFGTSDDMGFNSEEERRRVAAAAGCYSVGFPGWDEFPGNLLRLDTTAHSVGSFKVDPPVKGYFNPLWHPSPYPGGQDSVFVIWQAAESGVHFHFRVYADSLTGHVYGGPYRRSHITVHRTDCPS